MKSILKCILLFAFYTCISSAFAQSNCGSGGGTTVCLSASGSTNSVNLSWTVSGAVARIELYRDTDSNPNGRTRIAVPAKTAVSYSDTTAVAGTQYWYWVKFTTNGSQYNSGSATATRSSVSTALYPSYNTNPIAPNATGMSSNATQLAAKIKLGTNIGNQMDATGCTPAAETCWGHPVISEAYVKLIKDSGFDAIRLPVAWNQYADQQTGKISDVWLNRVKQVVQYAVDNGLYVFVNIHWDGGWLENTFQEAVTSEAKKNAVNAKQKAYWEQIATQLRDFDEHVIFASANEPDSSGPFGESASVSMQKVAILNMYHQTFVDAVRSTGGRNAYRVLAIQGLRTDIDLTDTYFNVMPSDTITGRQLAEVHFYPFSFTNQEKDEDYAHVFCYWGKDHHSTTDTYRNSDREEEDYVDAQFAKMKTKFVDRGIPVVLGEFAARLRSESVCADYPQHLASRAYYHQYVTNSALRNGMLPMYWETGSLFDRGIPAMTDQQNLDSLLVGAGKAVVLGSGPNSWTVSGATNNGSASNMQFTLTQAGATAGYTFANPVNWSGATLKVVLNFDQAFVSNRNGGMADLFQFYTYSSGWAASEWKCWTANKALVAGQDTEFTCSDFSLQNAVGLGLQFPGSAGTVTIKRAAIKLAQ